MLLKIISSEKILFEGEVESVDAPTISGHICILPKHVNLVSALDVGTMWAKTSTAKMEFVLNGGFVQVKNDEIIILANEAAVPKDIVRAEVEAAIKRAEEQISKDLPPQELILLEKQLRYEKLKLKQGR